jgi:hypothetical protein
MVSDWVESEIDAQIESHLRVPSQFRREIASAAASFYELCELARTLALRMVAHLLPDTDLGLRERGHDAVAVSERDEPVAVAPQRQHRPVVARPAAVNARRERPDAVSAPTP